MPANLPLLLPNQTLYSWCGQTHLLNCGTSSLQTSQQLFDAPYTALCHDFPANLQVLTQRTWGQLGSTREIALRHTLLGYFLTTIDGKEAERIIGLITDGAVPSLKLRLGITASRAGGFHPLKLCSDCAREEQERLGYSYWHIEHQYPSSFVCLTHSRPLSYLQDIATPVHRRCWMTPTDIKNCSLAEIRVPSDTAMLILSRLARDSMELAKLPPGSVSPARAASGYLRLLHQRGLATRDGNLQTWQLVSLIRERYRDLDSLPLMSPLASVEGDWPSLAASHPRRKPRREHPLKHLLLVGAIADSWDEFVLACEEGRESAAAAQQRCSHLEKNEDFIQFKQLVIEEKLSISRASKSVGVTRTTGTRWAKRLGIPYVRQSSSVTPTIVGEIRRQLAKGKRVSTIATSTGVSPAFLNRILNADERLKDSRNSVAFSRRRLIARTKFSRLCKKNKSLPLCELKKLPGNGYAWLYRNDRPWLSGASLSLARLPSGVHEAKH